MVDWSKVKKEYIPANQVPTGRGGNSPWDEIFAGIPRGQALMLNEPEVSAGTIRAALKRRQEQGKWKYLKFTSKGMHGSAKIYITNTEPEIRLVRTAKGKIDTAKVDTENIS